MTLYAATGKDMYRKPRPGIWAELCDDWDLSDVDLENSFFVGDAGGRGAVVSTQKGVKGTAKDFSCSDRNFAHNVGVAYKTPEEFFLGEQPRDFVREFDLVQYAAESADGDETLFEKKNDTDVVVFCGPPGAGKSTFFWKHLKPLGYERVNQDQLQSRDKCIKVAKECLGKGQSVAIGEFPRSDTARWRLTMVRQIIPTPTRTRAASGSTLPRSTMSLSAASGSRRP
jgi:bifunctional polynucleotide phosphatase/kinase